MTATPHRAGWAISSASYDRGCRCTQCRGANIARRAERREALRFHRLAVKMRQRPGKWVLMSQNVTLLPVSTTTERSGEYEVQSRGRDIFGRYVGRAA